MRPSFTLIVVATEDGFIARDSSHIPADWASPEEQALFLAEVDAADWSIMGRHTHQAADKPQRRRIIFSRAAATPDWRRPSQLWLDPSRLDPDDLGPLVAKVRPLRQGLILGGTGVHEWFHAAGRIDRILLSIEPVSFGAGLPIFSGHAGQPEAVVTGLGYKLTDTRSLNRTGTRLLTFAPPAAT